MQMKGWMVVPNSLPALAELSAALLSLPTIVNQIVIYVASLMPTALLITGPTNSRRYLDQNSLKEYTCNAGDASSIPGLGRSPREGMATHSSILAWKIPYTEEPGGLQSMGLQRDGYDSACMSMIHH